MHTASKYLFRLIFPALLIVPTACQDDFLAEVPYDFLSPANFYKTEKDAIAATTAAYSRLKLGNYYQIFYWMLADGSSDEMVVAGNKDWEFELNLHNYIPNSRAVVQSYESMFQAINPANAVIHYVPRIDMNPELRARLVAEARFLRALTYFNLVTSWGGVPLVTTPTEDLSESSLRVPRASAEEVYQLIIEDLLAAEADLPVSYTGTDVGRATRGAAKSLLAKVYLFRSDFALAAQKAKEVMDLGVYSLFADYRDVWKVENKNRVEHIFSVQRDCQASVATSGSELHSRRIFFYAPRGSAIIPGGEDGDWKAAPKFYANFPEDYRKDVTFMSQWTYPDGSTRTFAPTCWKYYDPNMCGRSLASNNEPILRYADVLLMYAEALNELNGPGPEAYEAINQVRRRARGVGTAFEKPAEVLPDLNDLSQEQFRQAVLDERNWELCYEGHRRYDLIRTGNFERVISDFLGRPVEPFRKLFPIPQNAMDANPALVQNEGY